MNTPSTRDELTVKLLIQLGFGATIVLPLLALLVLGCIAATGLAGGAATLVILVMLAGMIAVVLAAVFIQAEVQRRLREQFLSLVDICRDYAGGNHTVRASVSGDDAFALLVMALNTLLDSQAIEDPEQEEDIIRSQDYRISTLQAQVERLLREVGIVARRGLPLQSGVSAEALGLLADSFAYMIEGLAQTTKHIHVSTTRARAAANQAIEREQELGQQTEEQFAVLAQVIQEVEALAVFLQHVARNVQLGAEEAGEALAHMQQGKAAVNQALDQAGSLRTHVSEAAGALTRLDGEALEFTELLRTFADAVEHLGQVAQNAQVLESFVAGEARGEVGISEDLRRLAGRTASLHTCLGELVARVQERTHTAAHLLETNQQVTNEGAHLFAEADRALCQNKLPFCATSFAASTTDEAPILSSGKNVLRC
jgi:methyl-accepting chemotaxis protein